jgi:hypothetical protein
MNQAAILEWVRSFDGVTNDLCPDFDSLKDGVVLALIFNQLTDTPFNSSALHPVRQATEWVQILRNLHTLTATVRPVFDAAKIPLTSDLTGIARGSSPESFTSFLESFILYSLNGPTAADGRQRLAGLSPPSRDFLTKLIDSPPQIRSTGSEPSLALAQLEAELADLRIHHKRLQEEKQALLGQSDGSQSELDAVESNRQLLVQKGIELDAALQQREGVTEEKERLQRELDLITGQFRDLTRRLEESGPGIDSFRGSTDPEVLNFLGEIDEAERRLKPEFVEKIRSDSRILKRAIKAKAREAEEARSQLRSDMDDMDAVILVLDNEVDALVEANQRLNEETMALMAQVEALEKLKEPQSFLSHFRASARLLKPE